MIRRLRSRMTYANVASSIALFAALATGGAYAHGVITTSDIKDDAVTGAKISPKAFSVSDIERRGGQYEVGDSAIGSGEMAAIRTKTKNVRVPAIAAGQAGVRGAFVSCGKSVALGGGVHFGPQADQHQQVIAVRRESRTDWYAKGANYFNQPVTMTVEVYCLDQNG